jgi:hypothetical protein
MRGRRNARGGQLQGGGEGQDDIRHRSFFQPVVIIVVYRLQTILS